MTDILAGPNESAFYPEDAFTTFARLKNGEECPKEAGYIVPSDDLLVVFPQYRVAAWDEADVKEANVMKLETMHRLTESGQDFVAMLKQANDQIPTKELADWRIKHRWLRKTSLDELPQLMYNVFGLTGNIPINDLMDMRLVGAARPPLATEIELAGDNSNDLYNRALDELKVELGIESRQELHRTLGELYVPGFLTPATARGSRQLSTTGGFKRWAEGIIEYGRIQRLPYVARQRALGTIAAKTLVQVARRTDAA